MHHFLPYSVSCFAIVFGLITLAGAAFGQAAISIHSGLIQYTEGVVFLNDKPIKKTATNVPEIGKGGEFRTGPDSQAEVLLTPGVFLRLAKDSAIRMDSIDLTDTRVTVLKGTVMIECNELLKDNLISLSVSDQALQIRKTGLFEINADPAKVRVHKGQIFLADQPKLKIKKGKELALDTPGAKTAKFKTDKEDTLYRFSALRSNKNAYATAVAAYNRSVFSGNSCGMSSWSLVPQFGGYAYLPCRGVGISPFGDYFYSPSTIYLYSGYGHSSYGGGGSPASPGGNSHGSSGGPSAGPSSGAGMGGGPGAGHGPSMSPARPPAAPTMSAPSRSSGPAPRTPPRMQQR